MNSTKTLTLPYKRHAVPAKPSVTRALAKVIDPTMGEQLSKIHDSKLEEIEREDAVRLAAFMKEMAERD